MRSRNSLLPLLAAAAVFAQGELGGMLDGFQRRLPGANADAGEQHVRDVNALTAYWGRPNVWRGGGRQPLDRSAAYLGALQPFALRNPALAVALAGAWRQIGLVQEPYARDGALSAYNSSALLYSRVAGANPGARDNLLWLQGRVGGLGGTLPFLLNFPVGGAPRPPQGLDAVRANAIPVKVAPVPALVECPANANAPAELREQFSAVAATVHATHAAVQPVKESVAAMGQTLHPDVVRDTARMQSLTEQARDQIAAGQFEAAKENLGIAQALAQRVGKQFGR